MTGVSPRAEAESERVRAEVAGTPGAMRCGVNGCPTITQGAARGLQLHMRVVHDRENYFRQGGKNG